MTNLEKGKAMKCFGDMVLRVEQDPDPNAQDKLTAEYNCKYCNTYEYCKKLADTLR